MSNQNDHKDSFEQFIAGEVNRHEMFASDAVWAKINKQVQTPKQWPALPVIAFLIVVSLSIATALNYPPDNIIAKIQYNDSIKQEHILREQLAMSSISTQDNVENKITVADITAKTFRDINNKSANNSLPITPLPSQDSTLLVSIANNNITLKSSIIKSSSINDLAISNQGTELISEKIPSVEVLANDTKQWKDSLAAEKKPATDNNATDKSYKDFYALLKKKKGQPSAKWSYEIYATPSQSYRNLEDDKERDAFATPITQSGSLENVVKHKPALGLEAGIGIMYNITSRFKIKAGIQFNVRQYYIDAYNTYGIATVAIVENNRLDSLNLYSRYGNDGSRYSQTKLDNRLYQMSIPIGFQWDAVQGKKIGVSMGASIQPTFTLNKNVYLISTDYKYYANGESFFRKWNVNSAIDLTFSYQLRHSKFYLGPQVRYQHLPTYNDSYPIKEYRLDYGIKIGFVKPL